MKKNVLIILLSVFAMSCNSDDNNVPFTLENKVYKVVAFMVESNMDLNGDGLFTTDLLSELEPFNSEQLSNLLMTFLSDGTVYYPWYDWPEFNVINGEQVSNNQSLSSTSIPYRLNEPNIIFDMSRESLILNGELINNGSTIITSYDPHALYSSSNITFVGNFINETGEVETYTGKFIITLELQD